MYCSVRIHKTGDNESLQYTLPPPVCAGTHVRYVCVARVGVRLGQEARDTLDLIDQLLWVLGPAGESGFVFFDLDETLITRDTSLIDGLGSTRFVCF